ncbi:hypothetical protein Ade02nite_03500 [Paractinoplanes deccanensis]|uniref:DUF218 domain-containing protein n=1 Tax=Paractinoplanes deccanensis TaxID=113561 RepID=A0ABQ3XVD9_9ACTN|nr:ElyC/SanA/YdcF family protein [Actinoplanes deccanensis]GID71709.1 hypothetical protein Ade02nite_03500 [Actinoplanes deccanensis]
MDRVIGADDELLELFGSVIGILTVPSPDRVDALVVPTGQGEQWRIRHAIRLWEERPCARHLLVANGNPAEVTYSELSLDYLETLGLRRREGVVVQGEAAPNTGLQAKWIAAQVERLNVNSLGLVVSPYHLPRVFLTVLKELRSRVPMYPLAVPVPPHRKVPETGATAYELVPGEMLRILEYAKAGWVATGGELRDYLEWLDR